MYFWSAYPSMKTQCATSVFFFTVQVGLFYYKDSKIFTLRVNMMWVFVPEGGRILLH